MGITATEYRHIVLDEDRAPVIVETRMKILDLIEQSIAYGWSAEEIRFQHPSLSMGQIHSALSYYWDHVEEMDGELRRRAAEFDLLRERIEDRALAARIGRLKPRA